MTGKENYPPLRYISEADCNFVEISTKGFIKELIKDLECMKGTSENDFSTITIKRAITQINGQHEEIENLQKELASKGLKYSLLEREKAEDISGFVDDLKLARAEAIKDFAEQVQSEIRKALKNNYEVRRKRIERIEDERIFVCGDSFVQYCDGKIHALDGINAFIYDLVKEIVGDDK